MRTPIISLAAAVVLAVACGSSTEAPGVVTVTPTPVSKIVTFKATMNGASEVPVNASTGTGTFTAALDTSTNILTYDLAFSGLTSPVNNGHIHGPATATTSSGTTVNFTTLAGAAFSFGAASGTGHGVVLLTPNTQVTATINGDSLKKLLFAGATYANIHTTGSPGGEIRGMILKQ